MKSEQIVIRVTPRLKASIQSAAERQGKTTTAYIEDLAREDILARRGVFSLCDLANDPDYADYLDARERRRDRGEKLPPVKRAMR